MSKKLKALLLGVVVLGSCVTAVFAFSGPITAENEGSQIVAEDTKYVLREYEGYVAVFVENEPSIPMTVTDISVSTLRKLDRETLQIGLKVKTHERLMMILEDFSS